ncbi:MAG: endonuclease/exonuclease/phosphatase family protein [Bacteroidales bacterium]
MRSKFRALISLLALIILSESLVAESDSLVIRVMTYNIHHCNPPAQKGVIDTNGIADVILKFKADVVLLQEVDANTQRSGIGNQAQILARKCNLHHYHFYKSIDFSGGDYGVAILSRFPLSDRFQLMLSNEIISEQRTLGGATAEVSKGVKIIIATTHLDLVEGNRVKQVHQLDSLLAWKSYPVILGGDFNATPESSEIKRLFSSFTGKSGILANTFPNLNPDRTIDYIFIRNSVTSGESKYKLSLKNYFVPQEINTSDHLPVIADIVIPIK